MSAIRLIEPADLVEFRQGKVQVEQYGEKPRQGWSFSRAGGFAFLVAAVAIAAASYTPSRADAAKPEMARSELRSSIHSAFDAASIKEMDRLREWVKAKHEIQQRLAQADAEIAETKQRFAQIKPIHIPEMDDISEDDLALEPIDWGGPEKPKTAKADTDSELSM